MRIRAEKQNNWDGFVHMINLCQLVIGLDSNLSINVSIPKQSFMSKIQPPLDGTIDCLKHWL